MRIGDHEILCGDCRDVLPTLPSASVDVVLCDPPYPCIQRSYGYWTEAEWFALMDVVVPECRRVLKPTGSAVFILQPNSERVGRMRTWLWDFLARWGREWGVVQDAYWWNTSTTPTVHTHRDVGLMRGAVKHAVWLGPEDCYRDQDAVLWTESQENASKRVSGRATNELLHRVSGYTCRDLRQRQAAVERGGVTPFNLLPMGTHAGGGSNENRQHGHGASTPLALLRWWVRYLCPRGGVVLDPFLGSGTTALACAQEGRQCVGIELNPDYVAIAQRRLQEALGQAPGMLFAQEVANA